MFSYGDFRLKKTFLLYLLYLDFACCHIEGFMNIPLHDETKNMMAKKKSAQKKQTVEMTAIYI
jgi:hypothetical protein